MPITSVNGKPATQPTTLSQPVDPEISSWAGDTWRDVKEAFTSYHQMAMQAILMQAGETWIRWNTNKKVFEPDAPQDDWTPTPRINRFAPTVNSIAANVINVPEIEATVRGAQDDPLLWGIADIASRLADDWVSKVGIRSNSNNEEDKSGVAGMGFVLCGNMFLEVCEHVEKTLDMPNMQPQQVAQGQCPQCQQFYPDMQPIPGTQSYACPQCNAQIQPQPGMQMKPVLDPTTGEPSTLPLPIIDAECYVRLPIYMLPRPGSKSMSDTPYIVHAEREHLDYVHMVRGIPDADADQEHIDGFSVGYEHALNYYYQGTSQVTKSVQDSCLVVRFFVPPNKLEKFPDGFIATMTGGQVRKVDPWPDTNEHPIIHAVYERLLTLFMGRSVAFDLASLQKEYQSYESIIKLHGMTSAVEPIVIDSNTLVSDITGRSDKIIKWKSIGPGSKEPHRMRHGSLDEGIYRQRQALRDEFENVSGAVSVYRGMQPGSITAASAIDKLQGQAEMMFNKPVQNWNSMWKEAVRKATKIRQAKWTIAQIVEIVGEERMQHAQAFKQANLDKVLDWVATAHGLPRSRNEKKQEMMMLFDRGALDVTDPDVKEKIYQLFGETGMMNNFSLDATRARIENRDMKMGQPVQIMPEIEDMGVHLQTHLKAAKELGFDQWPAPSKQLMIQHIMETRAAIQQQMMEQAALQGPAQPPSAGHGPGAGSGPGGSSPSGHSGGGSGRPHPGPSSTGPSASGSGSPGPSSSSGAPSGMAGLPPGGVK